MKGERYNENRASGILISSMYLPSINYFFWIINSEWIKIEAQENYTRQTARNRCMICSANGPLRLTVPVVHPARESRDIRSIRIDHRLPWQKAHWRAIESAYNRAPFFLHYRDELERVLLQRVDFLFDLNLTLFETCLRMLKLKKMISITEKYDPQTPTELDLRISAKKMHHYSIQQMQRYPQVFEPSLGFVPNMSIVDLIFNRAGGAISYLTNCENE